MSREKQARRNQFDSGYAQGLNYNSSPIPGSPENIGGLQINMTGNPGNRADSLSQPSLDGKVRGMYEDREMSAAEVPAMGSVVKDHPRSAAQQGYDSVSFRGLNKLPISQTPPTPGEKEFAYLEANRLNGMGSSLPTQIPETFSTMGLVGQPAPIQGAKDPEGTPPQNSMMAFMSFDPSGSIIPGNNNTQKNNRGNA